MRIAHVMNAEVLDAWTLRSNGRNAQVFFAIATEHLRRDAIYSVRCRSGTGEKVWHPFRQICQCLRIERLPFVGRYATTCWLLITQVIRDFITGRWEVSRQE